jgi:hypothetical protein
MSTLTVPLVQHLDAECREVGLRVINHVIPTIAAGLHAGDADHLRHEAERWESMPPSPVRTAVLALVDGERIERRLRGGEGGNR